MGCALTSGLSGLLIVLGIAALHSARVSSQGTDLPAQVIFIDVPELAVLGNNGTFRDIDTPLNPTNHTPPFFQVWDSAFLQILGANPSVRVISERDDFAFAHEAPIWNPNTDDVFFASNGGGELGMSGPNRTNQVSRINLKDVKGTGPQNITFTKVPITPEIPYKDKLLFVASGRGDLPPGLSLVDPNPPFNSTTILDNFHGRQFNSLNDGKVHPKSQAIFFTDVLFGFFNGFRPPPQLPNQVYRLDPQTSQVRVVADGFDKCNGIAFSPDGSIAYITDSGAAIQGGINPTEASTIYAFDVDQTTQTFLNRRVIAYVDTDIPDGIQIDSQGNIYAGCGDGVQVFNPTGLLIGKIFLGAAGATMVFAGKGRMVIMGETKVYLVEFAADPSLVELE